MPSNIRNIGIRHRVKKLAAGEASPTQICVISSEGVKDYSLETETDELDWVLGQFPTSWRLANKAEDEQAVEELKAGRRRHHLRWRKVRKNEDSGVLSETRFVEDRKGTPYVLEIPVSLDGFRAGDTVGMALGGSGDRLAFALSRRADELGGGTRVLRLQPAKLKNLRERLAREKNEDARTLAEHARDHAEDFLTTTPRDRVLIRLGEIWRNRVDAMKARIGAEQRLRSHLIGQIFCSNEGRYPEGEIELIYEAARTNDRVIRALLEEEAARNREIEEILRDIEVYGQVLAPVTGVGPMIAARIIVAVGDIRRFNTDAQLKAFLGVYVMQGGRFGDRETSLQFVRRRSGKVANWHPDGRQALYLLMDQFNKRPNSPWGQKLLEYKAKLRAKHPVVECSICAVPIEECREKSAKGHSRRYSDGHIHKMAMWRTATKFVEWLWREWTRIERARLTAVPDEPTVKAA